MYEVCTHGGSKNEPDFRKDSLSSSASSAISHWKISVRARDYGDCHRDRYCIKHFFSRMPDEKKVFFLRILTWWAMIAGLWDGILCPLPISCSKALSLLIRFESSSVSSCLLWTHGEREGMAKEESVEILDPTRREELTERWWRMREVVCLVKGWLSGFRFWQCSQAL